MKLSQDRRIPDHVTVAIVGAGPAGLGVARVLRDLAIPDVWVLERGRIGQSFLRWPSGTRLLTPSFPGNVFGLTDLNAISYDSSPGWSLKREHPDGGCYARYLEQAALAFGLNVACGIEVLGLEPQGDGFVLRTDCGEIGADFVILACGQFGTPSDGGLIGAELARHYATVCRWQDVPGDEVFIIGGYESGIDAAIGLARAGKRATALERGAPWQDGDKDPSRALSPFTRQTGVVDFAAIPDVLLQWFLIPFTAAQALRFALERLLSGALFARLSEWVGLAVPLVTAALIVQIFAANIGTIAGHLAAFAVILIAIFLFFVATFLMGEGLARLFRLPCPQQALLAMTTAARNAPLMLAVTAMAIPEQPLILAAIVIGMLVEFPHLTALKQVLLRQAQRKGVSA